MFENKSTEFILGMLFFFMILSVSALLSSISLATPGELGSGSQETIENLSEQECTDSSEEDVEYWRNEYLRVARAYDNLTYIYNQKVYTSGQQREYFKESIEAWEDMMELKRLVPHVTIPQQVIIGRDGHGRSLYVNYEQTIYALNSPNSNIKLSCTKSMRGLFSCNDIILAYKPINEDEIFIGDVIVFQNPLDTTSMDTIHQIVKIGRDETGKYFTTLGYSNEDFLEYEKKIRMHNVKFKLIGILYGVGEGKEVGVVQ